MQTKIKDPDPVVIGCAVLLLSSLPLLILLSYYNTPIDKYSFSFKGDLSVTDGKLTLIAYNNQSGIGKSTPKTVSIYGLNTTPNILVTDLVDKTGKTIKSTHITVDALSVRRAKNITTATANSVKISIDKIQEGGQYQGSMIITTKNTNSSIPIIVATEPLLSRAIGWVLIGVLISLVLWEIINGLSQRTRESQREALKQSAASLKNVDSTTRELEYQANLQAAAIIGVKIEEYKKRYSKSGAPRQLILNVGSAFFGILVGLLALVNNDYVTGLRVIDFNAIMVLFGLGLGIGSLKEFVGKASS